VEGSGRDKEGVDLDALLARLDNDQYAAVTAPAGPVAVIAGAGSGKTRVLTSRIAYRIAQGTARPANVVAFTFTRQAASELQRRLFTAGVESSVLAGTFHSVAYRILRRRW
jgi:DNA helicase-2/ATP-dependent DNA helicase PcrA